MHKSLLSNCKLSFLQEPSDEPPQPWRCTFPMLADDFSFNYPRLMKASYTSNTPLGKADPSKAVAIIGAGISGTETARELARAGYTVHIYEATDRIGGRTNSWRAPATKGADPKGQLTVYEQGAMRIPFFNKNEPTQLGAGPYVGGPYFPEGAPIEQKEFTSMAEFWTNWYKISTAAFPDPAKAPGSKPGTYPGVATAVYVNEGRGVDLTSLYPEQPFINPAQTFMYSWPADSGSSENFPLADFRSQPVVQPSMFAFYNRGETMSVSPIPAVDLAHAVPYNAPTTKLTGKDMDAFNAGVFALRTVSYKWSMFAHAFLYTIAGQSYSLTGQDDLVGSFDRSLTKFSGDNWETFWRTKVMPRYQNVNFYEVAVAGPVLPTFQNGKWVAPREWADGNFGGLGMSGAEAQLFYTVGAGDGSWGAFFPNSALWALRALLFGFANEHQLILGCLNDKQTEVDPTLKPPPNTLPQGFGEPAWNARRATLKDSDGNKFFAPQYTGVNSFSECHFFKPCTTDNKSLWELVNTTGRVKLFTSSKVTLINRVGPGRIEVSINNEASLKGTYTHVVCTVPIWNTQTDMRMTGFYDDVQKRLLIPMDVSMGLRMSHWIRSAKVFVALNQPYWKFSDIDKRTGVKLLPAQVIATNTELQGMYGLLAPVGNPKSAERKQQAENPTGGVALISYTWEDDAQKFLPYQQKELVTMLMNRLDIVLEKAGLPKFSQFVLDPSFETPGSFSVFRWSLEQSYHGCAKAYQPGIENMNYALMTFNNFHSKDSGLYFAGDAYGMESGWLEPALRMGLDAAINVMNADNTLVNNSPALLGFNYATDYKTANQMTSQEASVTLPLGPGVTPGLRSTFHAGLTQFWLSPKEREAEAAKQGAAAACSGKTKSMSPKRKGHRAEN